MTPEQKKAIEVQYPLAPSINCKIYVEIDEIQLTQRKAAEFGFHLRDEEVERLKEVTIDLHHENNRLKRSIHPNPFEHPILESKLKELVWKLDREIWAKVEVHEATQSWGREQSSRLIREYFGESDNEINSLQDTINGQRLKLSELTMELDTLKKQVEELKKESKLRQDIIDGQRPKLSEYYDLLRRCYPFIKSIDNLEEPSALQKELAEHFKKTN